MIAFQQTLLLAIVVVILQRKQMPKDFGKCFLFGLAHFIFKEIRPQDVAEQIADAQKRQNFVGGGFWCISKDDLFHSGWKGFQKAPKVVVLMKILFGSLSNVPVVVFRVKDVTLANETPLGEVVLVEYRLPCSLGFFQGSNGIELSSLGFYHEIKYIGVDLMLVSTRVIIQSSIQVEQEYVYSIVVVVIVGFSGTRNLEVVFVLAVHLTILLSRYHFEIFFVCNRVVDSQSVETCELQLDESSVIANVRVSHSIF